MDIEMKITLRYINQNIDAAMVREVLEHELRLNWMRGHFDMGSNEVEDVRVDDVKVAEV